LSPALLLLEERERKIMSPTELELDNEGLGLLQEI
jgi:hypothetical protein